jgi:hypothetical protein
VFSNRSAGGGVDNSDTSSFSSNTNSIFPNPHKKLTSVNQNLLLISLNEFCYKNVIKNSPHKT